MVLRIKAILILSFEVGKQEKKNGPISPKIINELPAPTNQLLVTDMLSKTKNPKDYQERMEVHEFEQAPIDSNSKLIAETLEYKNNFKRVEQPPIAPSPKYLAKTNNLDKTDGSAKKMMDMKAAKRRAEKKINLEKQLSKSTAKMNIIKKPRTA